MPRTRNPLLRASIVAEAMTPLIPGAGPPPTRIARVSLIRWRIHAPMVLSYEAICFDLFGTLVEEDGRATEGARSALVTVPRERCAIVTSCGEQFAQIL